MSRFVLTAQLQLQAPNNVQQVVRQIQSQLQGVSVNVQVQGSAQAQRQLQQVTAQTQAATTAAQRMGNAFAVSVKRFAALGVATRAVSLLTSTLSNAVNEAISFERQLIKVSQITGKSIAQLRGLTKEISNLATGFGVASSDLLNVSTTLAQAGLSAKDTAVALRTLAKAALAPNFDSMSETAEGAIAILAQFGQGVQALEAQLSSINAVAGQFAVEAGDLIDVVRRTGGVFKSAGGDLNELIALFTSVRATTRESAESIGTGLRTIFTRIQRPKTIEYLKQFGVELTDINGKFVGPYEAVKRLSEALAGLGEGDLRFVEIAEELGGFRQIGKVLPLIQQFSTAQAALNVAQNAGNGLTEDAAKAQLALAIRVQKVKEEFLALIRGVTETTTFQVMANTALNLASALVKIGEAIKPLLPLLAALSAVKVAQGLGGFLGAAGRNLTSGRGYNLGGKVHAFARGGLVPGSGNRDTVPAMLSPGEFVIRKSSVNKMGASTLAAMNENRYATGGLIDRIAAGRKEVGAALLENRGVVPGGFVITKKDIEKKSGLSLNERFPRLGSFSAPREGLNKKTYDSFSKALDDAIVSAANQAAGFVANDLQLPIKKIDALTKSSFLSSINTGTRGNLFEDTLSVLQGGPFTQDPGRPFDFPTGLNSVLRDNYSNLPDAFIDAKASLSAASLTGKGSLYEKTTRQIAEELRMPENLKLYSNTLPTKGKEFVSGKKYMLSDLGMKKDEALSAGFVRSGSGFYTKRHSGGLIQKFATGGGVGTDTVPALLTPGEFVVNKKSAQAIGYGSLNRMNKVGKYAKGGVVQHFATGTSGSGAKPLNNIVSTTALPGFDTKPATLLNKVIGKFTGTIIATDKAMTNSSRYADLIATVYPDLADSIINNSLVVDDGSKRGRQLINAYGQIIDKLNNQGLETDEIIKDLKYFQIALDEDTAAKKASAAASKSATSSGPMGSPGSIPGMKQSPDLAARKARKDAAARRGFRGNSNSQGGAKDIAGAAIAFGMVTASLQAMLPPLDENASAFTKLSHQALGMVTTLTSLIFTLKAFGVELKAGGMRKFLSGGGLSGGAKQSIFSGARNLGLSKNMAGGITKFANVVSKAAGPLLALGGAAVAGANAFRTIYDTIYDFDGRMKTAIETGNVDQARSVAAEKAGTEGFGTMRSFGTVASAAGAGAIAGSFLPGIGTAIGGAVGTVVGGLMVLGDSFNDSAASQIAAAGVAAGSIKTQKALEAAQKSATDTMKDFENGSISASDALAKIRSSTSEVEAQRQRVSRSASANASDRSAGGFSARNIFSLGGLNPLMESSSARNSRLSQQNTENIKAYSKSQQEAFNLESPARSAAIRSGLARGKDINEVRQQAVGNLKSQQTEMQLLGNELQSKGDEAGAKAAFAAAQQMEDQIKQVNKEIENIEKEVKRQKDLFNAMNLGLRSAQATSSGLAASMERLSSGFEVGGSSVVADVEFLTTSLSSAAQAMDPAQIDDAIGNVSNTLREFGTSEQYIGKFENNMKAFTGAQQNYVQAFGALKDSMAEADFQNLNPDEFKEKFADQLAATLPPGEGADNLRKVIEGMELSSDDVTKILGGDLSVIGEQLSEAQKKQLDEIRQIAQDRQRAEQVLIDFTKKRIDAERNYVAAQQEAIDLIMEGRDIQAKYGGPAVSYEERKGAILAKSNAQSDRLGLTPLAGGDIGSLSQRNAQIRQQYAQIEAQRRTPGGMDGKAGVEADEKSKDLEKAQKEQVNTIRSLIKLEEEQLKITQEKNKLERSSLESLAKGDIDSFFKQQAAVGAQAAIASGSTALQNFYGTEALGTAFEDLKRQQEAGVTESFGQQLGGPGGLLERAAGASLSAAGVRDYRSAQVMAGTTGEEEASKARLRELGGALGDAGQLGADMAEMSVQTAEIQVQKAEVTFKETLDRGNKAAEKSKSIEERAAENYKARGGMIYANRGMFIPRGTDTVPAMLTPGEFVVNRAAVQRGNNLQILKAMNRGMGAAASGAVATMAKGGLVRYRADGSTQPEPANSSNNGMNDSMSKFTQALNAFNVKLGEHIKSLQGLSINVKLETANVNVNLNNVQFLNATISAIKKEVLEQVQKKIKEMKVDSGGGLSENPGPLSRAM